MHHRYFSRDASITAESLYRDATVIKRAKYCDVASYPDTACRSQPVTQILSVLFLFHARLQSVSKRRFAIHQVPDYIRDHLAQGGVYVTCFGWKITATLELHRHGHNSTTFGDYLCILFERAANYGAFSAGIRVIQLQCWEARRLYFAAALSDARRRKKLFPHNQTETSVGWSVIQRRL